MGIFAKLADNGLLGCRAVVGDGFLFALAPRNDQKKAGHY